jgi:hypothetical protein
MKCGRQCELLRTNTVEGKQERKIASLKELNRSLGLRRRSCVGLPAGPLTRQAASQTGPKRYKDE